MTVPVYHHVVDDDPEMSESSYDDAFMGSSVSSSFSPVESLTDAVDTRGQDDRWKRHWTVALFSACTILLFADQNLMSPNLTAIANDFGFSDEERDRKLGGQIALAFFVLGAPASFVVGCLGDTYNRSKLFACTVGIGEGACLATFFTRTFPELYACRAVTGFALGGALPLIYSVLGDLFAADERHSVSALVGIGTGAGISLGQGIAGFVGPTFGWRVPFLIISIPALLCATAVLFTVEDPERGGMEQAVREHRRRRDAEGNQSSAIEMAPLDDEIMMSAGDETGRNNEIVVDSSEFDIRVHWATFLALLSTPTVLLALLQGAPGCVPWGIVNAFLNDFLSENRGMSVEVRIAVGATGLFAAMDTLPYSHSRSQFATFTVLVFGLGNFFGLIVGGTGGTYLYRIDIRYPPLLSGSMAILGCFPFWILLNYIDQSSSFLTIGVVSILAGFATGVTGPIVKATLQNVTLPQSRGQAFALFNTFDDFGRGLGPVFVAHLIRTMGGRTPAFNVGVLGWILCGFFNLCMFLTVNRDENNVQAIIAASLADEGRSDDTDQCLDTEEETLRIEDVQDSLKRRNPSL